METYTLHLITLFGLSTALVAAADISLGGLGIFNVAQASAAALGAYTAAVISVHGGAPVLWAGPASLLFGGLAGLIVATLSSRVSGNVLVIATLCVALAITSAFRNASWITGGARGLSGVPLILPSGTFVANAVADAIAAFLLACIAAVAWMALRLGPARRSLIAVRDEPLASQAWGINPHLVTALGLGISGALAGLAGFIYVTHLQVISPAAFSLGDSFGLLAVSVLMSRFGFWGGILGAAWLVLLPEALALAAPTSPFVAVLRESLLAVFLPVVLLLRKH